MLRPFQRLLLCLGLLGLLSLPGRAAGLDWWEHLGIRDLNGAPLTPGGRWIVVVFISPECPVANAEIPVLNSLAAEYQPRGVTFVGAYADPNLSVPDLRQHASAYRLEFLTADDRNQHLMQAAGATYTPEVGVFSREGALLYHGRIDDRVEDFGGARPTASHEDLRDVLNALLSGRPAPFATRPGFGCSIPKLVRK